MKGYTVTITPGNRYASDLYQTWQAYLHKDNDTVVYLIEYILLIKTPEIIMIDEIYDVSALRHLSTSTEVQPLYFYLTMREILAEYNNTYNNARFCCSKTREDYLQGLMKELFG